MVMEKISNKTHNFVDMKTKLCNLEIFINV